MLLNLKEFVEFIKKQQEIVNNLRSKSSQYNALFNDLDANNLGFLSLKEIEECWKKMFQNNISKKNFVDVFGYEDASKINLEGKLGCLIKKSSL